MLITPERERELVSSVPAGLLIDGRWRDGSTGATFDIEDPATGAVLASLASGTTADALDALDAATRAAVQWEQTPPRERAEILRRGYELITARADDFALLITLEMGKPLAESYGEVAYGAEFLRWFAEEAVRDYGQYLPTPEGRTRILVRRKPVGPCLLITPWNFPLAMATRKIAPAVAAGCTMILKPAEATPLTSQLLARTLMEAGLPPGVLNVVPTMDAAGVCDVLIRDPRLRKLSFTGSTRIGKLLMARAADNVLRTSMELGGNAPFIVFADADLDKAVAGAVAAKMRNTGEACTAANRFLVEKPIAADFTSAFARAMAALRPGRGTDEASEVGPLISRSALTSVHGLVCAAADEGADVVTGGSPVDRSGHFYEPTVLADVAPDSSILRHEIFGPAAPVLTFESEAEAVELANATEYGLASYIYAADFDRMMRVTDRIEFGMVGFNAPIISNAAAPFGGVKHSGIGREGGAEGLSEYTAVQYMALSDPYGH